jgi:dipeptidyl aminopeptidase/acylaminoacyl peptidase
MMTTGGTASCRLCDTMLEGLIVAAGDRRLHPEDLLRLTTLDDLALSPDGSHVAATLRVAVPEADRYDSAVHLYPTDGSAPWQLTAGGRNWAPAWSPAGDRLAFLSDRSGSTQVWIIGMRGEARRLTSFPLGVAEGPVWSPDGQRVAVVVLQEGVDEHSSTGSGCGAAGEGHVIQRLRYRTDGQGYLHGRRHHLWSVDIRSGATVALTGGESDNYAPAWSPDGTSIAFVSNRADERLVEFRSAIWVAPASGGPSRRVTPEHGVALGPAWSPDGRTIAYSGLPPEVSYGANHRLMLVPASGDVPPRALVDAAGFEGHVGGTLFSDTWATGKAAQRLCWSPDGTAVFFVASRRSKVHVLAADLSGEVTTVAGGARACPMFTVSADGRALAYAASDARRPADIYLATTMDGRGWQQVCALSDLNPWLDEYALQRPLAFIVTGVDGRAMDAWLLPPVGAEAPVPSPLVQYIHGGPHSIFGPTFFFDMYLLSNRGYAVLFVNPRATHGYGDDFALCNLGRWGEGDTPDQLAALDVAVRSGWVDSTRVGAMGLSYGGYMVNWLLGHTDRFRAAVSENSISNLVSVYGTSDIGWYFFPRELAAEPDQDPERYARLSPLSAAGQIRAPLLLLQCEQDWRCPAEQGEQLYTALKRRGHTVEMVRFPGESHGMLSGGKPRARVSRRRHMLRWFDRYLAAPRGTEAGPHLA